MSDNNDNSMIPVSIRIMEKEYKISCPEGEHESLIASAKHVDENMRKMRDGGKALGAERIAVMSAINIAHELINSEASTGSNESIIAQIDSLQLSVDAVLDTHK